MKLLSRIEHYHCSLLYCSSFLESLKFSKIKLACRTSFTEFWRKFLIKRANKTKKLSEYGRLESEKFKDGYSTPRLPHVPISSHLNSLIVSCILFFSLMFTPAVQPFSFSRLPVITVLLFIISPRKSWLIALLLHCFFCPFPSCSPQFLIKKESGSVTMSPLSRSACHFRVVSLHLESYFCQSPSSPPTPRGVLFYLLLFRSNIETPSSLIWAYFRGHWAGICVTFDIIRRVVYLGNFKF